MFATAFDLAYGRVTNQGGVMPIELIEGKFRLADEEAINFLNASAGTTFNENHEIESVEVLTGEDGERTLIVVVGLKG